MSAFSSFVSRLDMTDFALYLKGLREKRQLTQTRLAELIGVSPRVYNRWENGVATPHFDTVVKIADILEVSLDTLAGRSEKEDNPAIHNAKLHELYKKVNQLPDEEQQALIILLDSLVARATLGRLVGESQKLRG